MLKFETQLDFAWLGLICTVSTRLDAQLDHTLYFITGSCTRVLPLNDHLFTIHWPK